MRRFLDSLFGRTRPAPSLIERLFAISTAQITMVTTLNLAPAGTAGISFRPVESNYFASLTQELNDLLEISARDTGTRVETQTDKYRFRWVLLHDDQFEDLVATIHVISQTLIEHQFGEQLLAAVFRFTDDEGKPIYWIYNYKRGNFYPFAPRGKNERDHAQELRMSNAMSREMPIETELERWYPLWDIPY